MKSLFFRWPSAIVILILGLQISLSLPRINEPILDGRLHWYFDNALFLLRAKHSNFQPPPKIAATEKSFLKIFGTATYGYDEKGEISRLNLYSHHPILSPALFRLYAKIFGYGNWVPRSFALMLSLMTTIVLFLLLKTVLRDDLMSCLLTLLYTLLPLNFMFMDQWKFEITTNLLFLLCFYFLAKVPTSQKSRLPFLCTVFLLFQSEWVFYFGAPCLLLYLFTKRKETAFRGLLLQTTVISILAVLINFVILYKLGFDLAEMRHAGGSRIMEGMAAVGLKGWLLRQLSYLDMNFGEVNIGVLLAGLTYLVVRRNRNTNILLFGSMMLIFSTVCYAGIFKNLSFIHHFLQWSVGPAMILLMGGILAAIPGEYLKRKGTISIVIAVALPLFFLTANSSYRFHEGIRAGVFGATSDLKAIKVLKKRLLVFDDGTSGPVNWWFGPVIDLAQDPIFHDTTGRGSVRRITEVSVIDPGKDIVVVLNTEGSLGSFRKRLREQFGIHQVKRLARSRSFSFFRVLEG